MAIGTIVNFRADESELRFIEEQADSAGVSRSEFLRTLAVEFPIHAGLQQQIRALAARVGLTAKQVLDGILCDYFAGLAVGAEKGAPRMFPEFQTPPLPPMELLDVLAEGKRIRARQDARNAAKLRELLGGAPVDDVGEEG